MKPLKLKAIVLLTLVFSLVVSGFLPALQVYADTASVMNDINNKYYAAVQLRDCLEGMRSAKTILESSAADPALLFVAAGQTTGITTIGKVYKSDDGKLSCGDGGAIAKALQTSGFSSGSDLLKNLGYSTTQISRQSCNSSYGGTTITGCTTVQENVYDISGPNLMNSHVPPQPPQAQYYGYRTVFEANCSIKEDPNGSYTLDKIVQDSADPNNYISQPTKVSFTAKTISTGSYTSPNGGGSVTIDDSSKVITQYDYIGGGKDNNIPCADLLTKLNNLTPKVIIYNKANPDAAITTKADVSGNKTAPTDATPQCAGGTLGWLLCPLVTMISDAMQSLAQGIGSYMQFEPLIGSRQGDAIFTLWKYVVTPANLLLLIAFLVVIFSQATSFGLSAYGIKKMLPRIIAAAILINLSFFICAVLVDAFNILGGSIANIITTANNSLTPPAGSLAVNHSPGNFGIAVGVLAALTTGGVFVATITGGIVFIFPLLLSALVSLGTLFLVLSLRHVFAILLIAIAPLAFAAMVLPNTEGFFKKWQKALMITLALYPVIMGLAYGSLLVSKIILMTGNEQPQDWKYLMTVAISFITLFGWIFALKFIVTWGGGVMGKLAGMVNDPKKGLIDRTRNWAREKQGRSTFSKYMNSRKEAGNLAADQRAIKRLGENTAMGRAARMTMSGRQRGAFDSKMAALKQQVYESDLKAQSFRFARGPEGDSLNEAKNTAIRLAKRGATEVEMQAIVDTMLSHKGGKTTLAHLFRDNEFMNDIINKSADGQAFSGLSRAAFSNSGFVNAHSDIHNAVSQHPGLFQKLAVQAGSVKGKNKANDTLLGDNFSLRADLKDENGNVVYETDANGNRVAKKVADGVRSWEWIGQRPPLIIQASQGHTGRMYQHISYDTAQTVKASNDFGNADPNIQDMINDIIAAGKPVNPRLKNNLGVIASGQQSTPKWFETM